MTCRTRLSFTTRLSLGSLVYVVLLEFGVKKIGSTKFGSYLNKDLDSMF
jgi:hypothetical protein